MEQEPQNSLPQTPRSPPVPIASKVSAGWPLWRVGIVGLCGLAAFVAGYFLLRDTAQDGNAQDLDKPPSPVFQGWKKPDLAIVVSGQMHGYTQPCGCSSPQYGGLSRRYNFMQSLKDKGWPVTAVDLGDIAQASGPQQALKYEVSMKALHLMGYRAIGIGKNELLMPLTDALAHYAINQPQPRPVAVNLDHTEKPGELFHDLNVRKYEVFQAGDFKIGVLGAIGPLTAKEVLGSLPAGQKDIKFLEGTAPKALAELGHQKINVAVLLYQGFEKEAMTTAELLHQNHLRNPDLAPVQVILCLTREEEPPGVPVKDAKFPNTSIISIGHKGRYVGVVGIWKNPKEIKYQLVSMGPELEPKPGKANPVMGLMEKYARDVRDHDFLARFPRGNHPNSHLFKAQNPKAEPFYAGSAECAKCHQDAHAIWKASGHAKAFTTLEKASNPSLRQFDGECVVCHTVGFQYLTGFNDPPAGSNPAERSRHNLSLRDVGCESCHGPAGEHASDSKNKLLYPIINPFSARANPKLSEKTRLQRIDDFCQKCHDPDNDVHWGQVNFQAKWQKVIHMTPTNKTAQAK